MFSLGNTFAKTSKSFGAGKHIWHEIKGQYPVGGVVDVASLADGTVIPAGSMCILNQQNHTVTIVKASETSNLANVNGLLMNDIVVEKPAGATNVAATAAVVFAGEIYVDRCAEAIPDSVLAKLPMIVAIKEA